MSESKIQVSFKFNNGTIPLFRGDSIAEVEEIIKDATLSPTFVGTLEAFAEAAGISNKPAAPVFASKPSVDSIAKSFGATVVSETSNGSSGPFRTCLHGTMDKVQGTSKFQKGEIYKSYMCPAPKGAMDKCKAISVKKGTPEWDAFVPDKVVG